MIWNKKGFLTFFFVALIIFNQGCDESVFRENPPTAYLELESISYIYTVGNELVSEPIELEQVQYGDNISIKLALKVDDMVDLYNMSFTVTFDREYFQLESTDFAFTVNNFFAQSQELFLDCGSDGTCDEDEEGYDADLNEDPSNDNWEDLNGNNIFDEGEGTEGNGVYDAGESFTDSVDNDVWDAFNEPVGTVIDDSDTIGDGILIGNIGVGAPEEHGTVWGSGVVCYLYFSGIMHPSFFDLIIDGVNDLGDGSQSVDTFSWDIFPFSLASPTNPSLQIIGSTVTDDNKITVSVYIEDSSPLSYLNAKFTYDPVHLTYNDHNFGGFFSEPLYVLDITPPNSSEDNDEYNEISFISRIDGMDPNPSNLLAEIELDPSSLSEGNGNIVHIIFDIQDFQIESTLLQFELIQALGYSSSLGVPISLNTQHWEFEQGIELDLTNLSAIDG